VPLDIRVGYVPGCIGRITTLHALYYARVVGFGLPFEVRVASELAAFCASYDARRDGLWLAERERTIVGSIAIDGARYADAGAHLRWFITADDVRGTGAGGRLLADAMAFCDARGYDNVYLWTFDGLRAARHLYEKHGFVLRRERRGTQWGKPVDEQLFTRGSPAIGESDGAASGDRRSPGRCTR
jgi:GNAT superfamily N-acetyltransferase